MTRQWEKEFGAAYAVPLEIEELVNRGLLTDDSWHNDMMPVFSTENLVIWVDHPDPKQRQSWLDAELEWKRFHVTTIGPDKSDRTAGMPEGAQLRPVDLYIEDTCSEALRAMGFSNNEWGFDGASCFHCGAEFHVGDPGTDAGGDKDWCGKCSRYVESLYTVEVTIRGPLGTTQHEGALSNKAIGALLFVLEAGNHIGNEVD